MTIKIIKFKSVEVKNLNMFNLIYKRHQMQLKKSVNMLQLKSHYSVCCLLCYKNKLTLSFISNKKHT